MAGDDKLKRLLTKAPNDMWALIELLRDGLDWPFPEMSPSTLQPDDVLIDWHPEELHLDRDKVADRAEIPGVGGKDQLCLRRRCESAKSQECEEDMSSCRHGADWCL